MNLNPLCTNVLSILIYKIREHWAVYYTSPKVLLSFLIRWRNNFGNFYWILIGWFIKLSFQTFQPLILIYRRVNFVYPYWGWTSIYRLLSYPFRSLGKGAIETQNHRFRPSTVSLSLALTYTLRRGIAHALVRFSWGHTDHQLPNQVGYHTVSLRRKHLYWNISCNYIKSLLNRRVSDLYMLRQLS